MFDSNRNSFFFKNDDAMYQFSRGSEPIRTRKSKQPKNNSTQHIQSDADYTKEYIAHTSISIEKRIQQYELRYRACMEAHSELTKWVAAFKTKGPPSMLLERESTRTTTATISPSSRHMFTSKSKRSTGAPLTMNKRESITPSVKASISTLIRKATDSIKPTRYKHERSSRDSMIFSSDYREVNGQRKKALLNRFSLYESGRNNIMPTIQTIDKNLIRVVPDTSCKIRIDYTSSGHSTVVPTVRTRHTKLSNSVEGKPTKQETEIAMTKTQSAETMLSHSSSIFLRKLRSKPSTLDEATATGTVQHAAQPNVPLKSKTYQYSLKSGSTSSGLTEDDDNSSTASPSPPSSPASIDSIVSSPLFVVASSHRNTLSPECHPKVIEKEVAVNEIPRSTAMHVLPIKYQQNIQRSRRSHHQQQQQAQQKQNNRASMLVAPSFSTLRYFSQKSQFFKRQSMLA